MKRNHNLKTITFAKCYKMLKSVKKFNYQEFFLAICSGLKREQPKSHFWRVIVIKGI